MRRAQAERSRTHARTRTRRKKTNTQADANEEEPSTCDTMRTRISHKLSLYPHLMKLLNESTNRTQRRTKRKQAATPFFCFFFNLAYLLTEILIFSPQCIQIMYVSFSLASSATNSESETPIMSAISWSLPTLGFLPPTI